MSREDLAKAKTRIESAADAADEEDVTDRLDDLATQIDNLTERDQAPDHGRLARVELILDDVVENADDDELATEVDAAHEHVVSFRETVEGV